jgi:hypothetical protein
MMRWVVAVLLLVTLTISVVVVMGLSSSRTNPFSCPTGGDLYSRSCAEAAKACQEDHGVGGGAADDDGYSYVWKCEDGVMTSFSFPG